MAAAGASNSMLSHRPRLLWRLAVAVSLAGSVTGLAGLGVSGVVVSAAEVLSLRAGSSLTSIHEL